VVVCKYMSCTYPLLLAPICVALLSDRAGLDCISLYSVGFEMFLFFLSFRRMEYEVALGEESTGTMLWM